MSSGRTPRSGNSQKTWTPRKPEEKSARDSKGSSARWETVSPSSSPRTGRVRPSSWDNSDEENPSEINLQYFPTIFSNIYENSGNEINPNYEDNDTGVYSTFLEDVKLSNLDRRQSPARVRRRTKSSGSSSPILEGKNSEKEGNLSSEDSEDNISPQFNHYLDFNNILSDMNFKLIDMEESKNLDSRNITPSSLVTFNDLGSRFCRTSRKLSKILEVEEFKKDSDSKSKTELNNSINVTVNSVLLVKSSHQDDYNFSLHPNAETSPQNVSPSCNTSSNDEKGVSMSKTSKVESLNSKTRSPDSKKGRCTLLECNDSDEVIFLTAKTGKTEIGFSKESSWLDWPNKPSSDNTFSAAKAKELEMLEKAEGVEKMLKMNFGKESESADFESSNPSGRRFKEDLLFIESPKFRIDLDSARSLEVEDFRTPSSGKQSKSMKSNRSTQENPIVSGSSKKHNSFDIKGERSIYSRKPSPREKSSFDNRRPIMHKEEEKIFQECSSEDSIVLPRSSISSKSRERLFTWEKLAEITKYHENFNSSRTIQDGEEDTGFEVRESEVDVEWDKTEDFNSGRSSKTQTSQKNEKFYFPKNSSQSNRSSGSTTHSQKSVKFMRESDVLTLRTPSPKDEKKSGSFRDSRSSSRSSKRKDIEGSNTSRSRKNSREPEVNSVNVSKATSKNLKGFAKKNYTSDSSSDSSIEKDLNDDLKSSQRSNLPKKYHKYKGSPGSKRGKTEKTQQPQISSNPSNDYAMRFRIPKQEFVYHSSTEINEDVSQKIQEKDGSRKLQNQKTSKSTSPKTKRLIEEAIDNDSNLSPSGSPTKSPRRSAMNHRLQFDTSQEPEAQMNQNQEKQNKTIPSNFYPINQPPNVSSHEYEFSEKSFGRITFDDIIKNFESRSTETLSEEEEAEEYFAKNKQKNEDFISQRLALSQELSEENDNEICFNNESQTVASSRTKQDKNSPKDKPVNDTATWNDLIETFDRNQKYPFENNFPGFPVGSQLHDKKQYESPPDQARSHDYGGPAAKETKESSRTPRTKEDSASPPHSGFQSSSNEKSSKKKENYLGCSSQTFFFDVEKKEPFGIGEFGDATFWNFGDFKKTDSDKPKDHGDGDRTFEKWEENNFPLKKAKESKTQRQLWTELKAQSLNQRPAGGTFILREVNIQTDSQFPAFVFKKSVSEEHLNKLKATAEKTSLFSGVQFDSFQHRQQNNGETKIKTRSNSDLCLASSDSEGKLSKLQISTNSKNFRRLSYSAFTINTTTFENDILTDLSNNSEALKRKNVLNLSNDNQTNSNKFLVKKDKSKATEKSNNWLIVHHSNKKKKMKKFKRTEQGKGFSLLNSEANASRQTPPDIPVLRLRKTGCLQRLCRSVVSVFCLTSDSSAATSN